MGYLETTKELLGRLDFDELRVHRPKSLVFLCGGRSVEAAIGASSVREALLRHLPARDKIGQSEILLAERATEALPETSFDNLLDLEEFIAAIVDAVVLIVESAGSICELGAFAKTDEIRRKIVIIINNNHNNSKSFITLGALNYIRNNSDSVEIHPFDWTFANSLAEVPVYALDGMVTEISSILSKIEKRPKFDADQVGHRIILTLGFCHILRGAKNIELKECFKWAGLHVTDKDLRRYLDTLRICGFLDRVSNGAKHVYFVSLVERLPLRVAFKADTPNDDRNILRWISRIAKEITDEDPVRMKIFQEHNNAA